MNMAVSCGYCWEQKCKGAVKNLLYKRYTSTAAPAYRVHSGSNAAVSLSYEVQSHSKQNVWKHCPPEKPYENETIRCEIVACNNRLVGLPAEHLILSHVNPCNLASLVHVIKLSLKQRERGLNRPCAPGASARILSLSLLQLSAPPPSFPSAQHSLRTCQVKSTVAYQSWMKEMIIITAYNSYLPIMDERNDNNNSIQRLPTNHG